MHKRLRESAGQGLRTLPPALAPALAAAALLLTASASAEEGGRLIGTVKDLTTEAPLKDVAVVATSPALQGEQRALTDARGHYHFEGLPPGDYSVRLLRQEYKPHVNDRVALRVGATIRYNVLLRHEDALQDPRAAPTAAPSINSGGTSLAVTVDQDLARRLPLWDPAVKGSPSLSFEGAALLAPWAQPDTYGVSLGGTTSLESRYAIDGLVVSDTAYGLLGAPFPIEFTSEVRTTAAGMGPEIGRAPGGAIEATTKSGGNKLRGSVWTSLVPGAFEGPRAEVRRATETLGATTSLSSIQRFGVDIGGPILKDKLWFYAGVSPYGARYRIDRTVNRLVVSDGQVQTESNGLPITERIPSATRAYHADRAGLQYIAKLTYRVDRNDTLALTVFGSQEKSGGGGYLGVDRRTGLPEGGDLAGAYTALAHTYRDSSSGVVLRWSSLFPETRLRLDSSIGWHHVETGVLPSDGSEPGSGEGYSGVARVLLRRTNPDRYNLADIEPALALAEACAPQPGPPDGTSNPPPVNVCPLSSYAHLGPGLLERTAQDRYQASITASLPVSFAGQHVLQVGLDAAASTYFLRKAYSGNRQLRETLSGDTFAETRFGYLNAEGDAVLLGGYETDPISMEIGAFARHAWTIVDRLTLSAGLRYDGQFLSGSGPGLSLPFQLSPRLGAAFDPTGSGRARLFVNYARYHQSLPLNLAARTFLGERIIQGARSGAGPNGCDPRTIPGQQSLSCQEDSTLLPLGGTTRWSASTTRKGVDPALRPQRLDELLIGAEYEIVPGARAAVHYIQRRQDTIIEDVAFNRGSNTVIGNPGLTKNSPTPPAHRDYDAVTFSLEKAFSGGLFAHASYTGSYLRGNWSGLFRPENNQLDPNLNSDFDLYSLTENTTGPLPGDHTHQLRLYGAKDLALARWIDASLGLALSSRSGAPTSYLAAHPTYGDDMAYILPRGAGDRLPWVHSVDTHIGFAFKLDRERTLTVGTDIFNIFNFQAETARNERFTRATLDRIPDGGTTADLPRKNADGTYTCTPPQCKLHYADVGGDFDGRDVNPEFGHPLAYQAPRSFRLSARVDF